MANERCPMCGAEWWQHTGGGLTCPRPCHHGKDELPSATPPKTLGSAPPVSAKGTRIAELESLLRASEARERELQGKLEEAKEATRVARETNTLLREKGGLQLEYAALSRVALDYKRELDAALAQVVELMEALECHGDHSPDCATEDIDGSAYECDCGFDDALSNTTAQRVKDEIERDVREAVWDKVKDMWGASPMQFRAAILGEKENN